MKKRIIAMAMAVGMLGVTVAGCSTKTTETTEKKSGSEITVMIPDWGVPSDELLDEFEKEKGISVEVEEVSWDDIRDKVSTAAAGKKAPADVFEVDWSWVGEFNSAGWLEPIEVSEEDKAGMPTLQSFTADGEVLAMPYANDFRLAYYNTEQFGAAGITEAPKTWDKVYEDSKAIKEKNIVQYPFTMPLNAEESTTTSLIWLAFTKGGVVFNEDNTLNKESVLDALNFIDKMNKEGLINPANRTSSGMDAYRQVTSGDASFMVGPTSFVGRVNDEVESKVVGKVMPILVPGQEDTSKQTFALPEGIGVSKFSENKEAATEFVKWYTSEETQEKLYEANNTIPTRTAVLEKLINEGKMKNTGAMLEESKLIASPFPSGVPNYYTEMSTAIFNAVNGMATGNLSPEQAFEEMNAKVTALAKGNN